MAASPDRHSLLTGSGNSCVELTPAEMSDS